MRSFRRGRTPKLQLTWDRFSFAMTTGAGSGVAVNSLIASPAFLQAGVVDETWTLRSQRLVLSYHLIWTVGVANTIPVLWLGTYRKDSNNATIAAPTAPLTEDWTDLWNVQFPPHAAAGPLADVPLTVTERGERFHRSQRKLTSDEGIWLSMQVAYASAGTDVGFQGVVVCVVSNLWSRTLRK